MPPGSDFLASLHIPGTVFLIGGPANVRRAAAFIAATGAERTINACGLRLIEAAALLRLADLFVGPSSGPLNLAAAGGTDAFGLRLVALYRPIRNLSTPSCRPAAPPLLA
jgi:ADP-heptose:LPS heptosyltransferase